MELKWENVQMMRVKSEASSQVTFDADYNVPDAKPDIGRMIQNKGDIQMDEVRMSEGHAFLKGSLNVDLLYVGDEEKKVYSLSAKLPLEETLNLEGIVSGDKMCLKWEIEDLSVHLIHSRKINIKAVAAFHAVVDETAEIRLPVYLEEEGISVQKKNMQILSLAVHKKDTLRLKEEISLASNKPNIAELLWFSIQVRGLDLRPEENAVKAKGEIAVFVLYAGDDEGNPLQWLEYSLPFSGEVDCSGCTGEMIPDMDVVVINQGIEVKPDADGEERVLLADVVLELDMKLYREEEHDIIMDVYTPLKECIPHGRTEILESLLVRNFSKCRLSDRVEVKENQGKILQICHSQGRVKVDKTQITENGVQAEGIVQMKILYSVGNDDMPFYSMETVIPFAQVVEARGIMPDCKYILKADLEQLSTTMVDSNEIEVKAAVNLTVLVMRQKETEIIEYVEEKPLNMDRIREMSGITVYITKQEDDLWDIAKRFYTTVDEIKALNKLKDEKIKPFQPLLLVKKVEG